MKTKNNFFTEKELDSMLAEKSLDPRLKGVLEIQMEATKTPSVIMSLRSVQFVAAAEVSEFYGEESMECVEMHTYGKILSKEEREKIRIREKISQILKKNKVR
jgi:hypothetical protein